MPISVEAAIAKSGQQRSSIRRTGFAVKGIGEFGVHYKNDPSTLGGGRTPTMPGVPSFLQELTTLKIPQAASISSQAKTLKVEIPTEATVIQNIVNMGGKKKGDGGHPENAEIMEELTDQIWEKVKKAGYKGKEAEKKFYECLNEAIDPYSDTQRDEDTGGYTENSTIRGRRVQESLTKKAFRWLTGEPPDQ